MSDIYGRTAKVAVRRPGRRNINLCSLGTLKVDRPRYRQRRITQARIATTRDNQISTVAITEPACAG